MASIAPAENRVPGESAVAAVVHELRFRLGNRVVTNLAVREQHGNTVSWVKAEPPDAVVFPHSTQDVSDIVKLCATHRVPVIAFGSGTSLEGHVNAPLGGICLDLSQMKRVVAVHTEDLDCVIEPGITRKELNEHLRDQGLFFPIDPGADASIGGMVATRTSGTNAVRYGTMKDCVLALTVVLPNGDVVKTAQCAKKSAAGYDLTHLFIGAEGTLGIITEITLKLHGIPEAISAGVCQFPSVKAACDAVIATIQSGLSVARIELLDQMQVRALNLYSKLGLPESPMLLLEFHGSDASVQEQAARFGDIATDHGCEKFEWATKPEDRTKLWQARHDAHWSVRALRPGANSISTDVCVSISRLAECVEETQRDIEEMGLLAPIVGHVGDGNFHCLPLVDTSNAVEVANVQEFIDRLVARAIRMNGTCTGEHGVGQKKMRYLEAEHGLPAVDLMRTLKRAIDPMNIMNPGKVVAV